MSEGIQLLADENIDNNILRGVLLRCSSAQIVRVQDLGLSGSNDADVLDWAARNERVVVTHDISTMKSAAYSRVASGLRMPGVFLIAQQLPIGRAIEAIVLVAECSFQGEWEGQVRHLPL